MTEQAVHVWLVRAAGRGFATRLARIQRGERTTFDFREYLSAMGWDAERGLMFFACPDPFPLTDPVRCRWCGEVFNESEMPARRLVREQISGPAERCHPAEYEDVCPGCGRAAHLRPAIRCAECNEHLCVCYAEDLQEPER